MSDEALPLNFAPRVMRIRVLTQARVPQDGRKYSVAGDPWHEFEVEVELDLQALAAKVARQAAHNRTGRSHMFDDHGRGRVLNRGGRPLETTSNVG